MQALINNYTAIECGVETYPKVANIHYETEVHRSVSSSIIISFSSESGINQRILNLLNEYAQLKNNWDNDDAEVPSKKVLDSASFLTKTLEKHGQKIFHAAPGPNGEIMLDIRNVQNTKSLEIIFYADRAVSVLFAQEEKPTQKPFDFQNLPQLLQWLNQK